MNGKKTFFLLYPFMGIYAFFRWTIIGFLSSFVFFVSLVTNILIYAVRGVYHTLVTLPSSILKSNKSSKPPKEKPVKTPKVKKLKEPIVASAKTTPTLKVELKGKDVGLSDVALNKKEVNIKLTTEEKNNKKKIMKERQLKHKKELQLEKEKKVLSKKQAAKLQAEKAMLLNDLASGTVKRSEKPVAFRYKAISPTGKMVKGTFTGKSKLDVNAYLVNEGYDVYSIKTSDTINFLYGQGSFGVRRMSNKDLIFWLTQLYTYLKSGIPLTEAVKILANQMGKNKAKKKTFDKIGYELTMGTSFSDALEKQGNVFPPLLVNMIKAAEATGELEETLEDMANYYQEAEKTRKQMISALTYPSIVTVFAVAVITFILIYVVPQFTEIYESSGIEITGLTKIVINLSDSLKQNFSFILLAVVISLSLIVLAYSKIKIFRRSMQVLLMHIPVIKNIIIYKEMNMFTKTFASLLKNNVFITDSVEILSKITNNEIYKEIMYNTISNIASGEKISVSFKNHWAVPDVAYYMIVTGESTGELANMMANVSAYYQEQHRSIVNNLKSFIEPIMIVSLALIVGVVILSVIIPMFDLYGNISV